MKYKPYFMSNKEWFCFDQDEGVFKLTDKAPDETHKSYDVYLEMLDCDELLSEYRDVFNKNFPLFKVNQMYDDDVKRIIRECIAKNKPFKSVYYKKGYVY